MENRKELFIKAFMDAENMNVGLYRNENDFSWVFSKKFKKSMNNLINKDNRIKFSTRRKISKGLIVAIITIIVMFTGLMTVSATRTPFVEFLKKVLPQYNEITLTEESTPPVDYIETEYTLTNVPEGYEIITYQKDELSVFTVWENEDGNQIVFSQNTLGGNLSIDNEHNYQELIINGYNAYLNQYKTNSSLKWTDGNYLFTLNISNDLCDKMVDLAENISEKN